MEEHEHEKFSTKKKREKSPRRCRESVRFGIQFFTQKKKEKKKREKGTFIMDILMGEA